jgi:hypothetical protein
VTTPDLDPPREVSFTLPLHLVNSTNRREHWAVKHRRSSAERRAVTMAWRVHCREPIDSQFGYVVQLTYIGPRKLDSDGVVAAFKSVRDQIADELGINDGDAGTTWNYAQRRSRPGQYAAEVKVTEVQF